LAFARVLICPLSTNLFKLVPLVILIFVSFVRLKRDYILFQMSSEKSDNPVEAQPLWEYPCKALSSSFDIIKLDLTRTVNLNERKKIIGEIPILE